MIGYGIRNAETPSSIAVVLEGYFVDIVPSGNLPREFEVEVRCFVDIFCLHHRGITISFPRKISETSNLSAELTHLISQYDFITFSFHKSFKSYVLFSYLILTLSVLTFAHSVFILRTTATKFIVVCVLRCERDFNYIQWLS